MILGYPVGEVITLVLALLAAGALTGIFAGLFGIGGGAIIVPVLYELFRFLGVPEDVRMPLCVGTSLAIIVPTSIRSAMAHYRRGAVDMAVIKAWAVPLVLGVLAGSVVARYAPAGVFKAVFVGVATLNAVKLLAGRDSWRSSSDLPQGFGMKAYGFVIGILSALMGIGGGALSTMVMTFHRRAIHQAIATSAAVGVLISLPGTLGYVYAGWPQMAVLPPLSLGYVSLIGVALFVPTSILTTPLGVRLAHSWPKRRLEVAFGVFLLAVAARFAISLF